tara:strand:+ start:101 stop:1183 length:1083 start_codon:yes stop_codon:yes gene_type:complete
MKKIFFIITIILIIGCSKDDDSSDSNSTEAVTPETFGSWSPDFTDQTSNFEQSRTGSAGTKQTRNVTVTSSVSSDETNERIGDNPDINNDGDYVDYYANITTTYSASIGGEFSVQSVEITKDQPLNFLTYNYGVWSTNDEGSIIPSNVTADPGTDFEESVSVDVNMAYEILDEAVNFYTADSVDSCYTLEEVDLPEDVSIEVIKLTLDEYESDVYGLDPEDYIDQETIDLLAELEVYALGQYTVMEIIDYEDYSALYVGAAIYAEFSDGSQYIFYGLGYTMVYYGLLDTSEYVCASTTGKSFKNVKSFSERNGIDLNKNNHSFKKFLESKKTKSLNRVHYNKNYIKEFLETKKIKYLINK